MAAPSPILAALYEGNRDHAERLAGESDLDVFEAAALGRAERVRELLEAQPELARAWTDDGFTALHYAAFFDGPEVPRLLIESGADVNVIARNEQFKVAPLHSAAASRQTETVQALLEAGAEIDARQPGGFTALHAAAQNGDRATLDVLVDGGADRSATTDDGRTAADFAREHGHDELVAVLDSV